MKIKEKVEKILIEYMDMPDNKFENGYIPDLFDVEALRDDIIKLIKAENKCKTLK